MSALGVLVITLALPGLVAGTWWTLLNLVALRRPRRALAAPRVPRPLRPPRLAVLVPAHDEEAALPACLASLAAAAFVPRPEVVVIADNCSDRTAAVARAAGVSVLVRDDPRRGKGYALEFAVEALAARRRPPDAVLFIDADSTVSRDIYTAIAARLAGGARAVQVYYEAERGTTSLSGLRRLAFMLLHWSRPLGARRLGLGTAIRGNGMALAFDAARGGLGAHGIAEDAAMTLALARRGDAVAFEPSAWVRGMMAARYRGARTQDRRWEAGRLALAPRALAIAAGQLARGRAASAASALEVAVPPLSLLVASTLVALALAAATGAGRGWALAGAAAVATYVVTGLAAARPPMRDLLALRDAPRFLFHKLTVYASLAVGRAPRTWQRTER